MGFPTKNDDFGVWNGVRTTIFLGKPPKMNIKLNGIWKQKNTWHFFLRDGYAAGDAPMDQILKTINAGTMMETVCTHWPNLLASK